MRTNTLPALILFACLTSACGGAPGAPGPKGDTGNTGPQGAMGSGMNISHSSNCSKMVTFSGYGSLVFLYSTVTFTNGVTWNECSVSGNSNTSSNSGFGGTDCIVTSDTLDGSPTGGFWRFSTNGQARQIVYTDSSSPLSNQLVSFSAGSNGPDCYSF